MVNITNITDTKILEIRLRAEEMSKSRVRAARGNPHVISVHSVHHNLETPWYYFSFIGEHRCPLNIDN